MAAPLLYRPQQRWLIWAAFGTSILIHLAAVGAAQVREEKTIAPIVEADQPITGMEIETIPPEPEPVESPLTQPPPPPEMEPIFIEPTPSSQPTRRVKPESPIARTAAPSTGHEMNMRTARAVALSAPRPIYPYEARRQHLSGSGLAVLRVDFATGFVTEVEMAQSTGSAILDEATVSAFRRWRFKPGTVEAVRTPITFTLTGAEF